MSIGDEYTAVFDSVRDLHSAKYARFWQVAKGCQAYLAKYVPEFAHPMTTSDHCHFSGAQPLLLIHLWLNATVSIMCLRWPLRCSGLSLGERRTPGEYKELAEARYHIVESSK